MRHLVRALILLVIVGPACAGDLCKENSFTKTQATQGRWAYDSSCGLCHLFNLKGRAAGNFRNETPDVGILDANYLHALDNNGGMTPPLTGDAFMKKWKDQKAFADRISNATGAFPPKNYLKSDSEAQIAAYILYVYCKKM